MLSRAALAAVWWKLDAPLSAKATASAYKAGTGWAIAQRFADEGAKVVVAARREAPFIQLAQRISGVAQACDVNSILPGTIRSEMSSAPYFRSLLQLAILFLMIRLSFLMITDGEVAVSS